MRTTNDISDKALKRITDFLNESSCLPVEEISAIDHQTPMTQELFERCLSDLVRINSSTGFDRLCNEFPGLFKSYEKKEKAYLEKLDSLDTLQTDTDKCWKELCDRLRKKYGDIMD